MGYYINPRNMSKETFLVEYGTEVPGKTLEWDAVPSGCLPVVLLQNPMFSAAGIAYCKEELEAFTDPTDYRPRTIFIVEIKNIVQVAGPDFRAWAEDNGFVEKPPHTN